MIEYSLTQEDALSLPFGLETTSLETLMLAIANIPDDDIWCYWVEEHVYGEYKVLSESLDEWLYTLIGRKF